MYMITGMDFKPHVYSIRMFETVEDAQKYLDGLRGLDSPLAPNCFKIHPGEKPELMPKAWLKEHIWPHTAYNKEYKARQEDLTRIDNV